MTGPSFFGDGGSPGRRLSVCLSHEVSKGRTVREFLLGVILVPTLMTDTFGSRSLVTRRCLSKSLETVGIADAVSNNMAVALFVLFEQFPLQAFSSLLGIIVVVIFFVSSSDSASLVVDIITAGGNTNPPLKQRVFWATMRRGHSSRVVVRRRASGPTDRFAQYRTALRSCSTGHVRKPHGGISTRMPYTVKNVNGMGRVLL